MRRTHNDLFNTFLEIKKTNSLPFYDTHRHPLDVFGFSKGINSKTQLGPHISLLEKLKFNGFALFCLEKTFYYLPGYIKKEIIKNFVSVNELSVLNSMEQSGIDMSTLLPVAPAVSSYELNTQFSSDKFIKTGSIDIHAIDSNLIEEEIVKQMRETNIKGLKLHPAIQDFYPLPEANEDEIRFKLEKIYDVVNKHKLYTIFHAGTSYVPMGNKFVKTNKAILQNFIASNGGKSVFELIHGSVVLAHLGNYNIVSPDFDLIQQIVANHENIFFDTAGINPKHIRKFINDNGVDRLIFGSDSEYFNLKYSIDLVLKELNMFKENNKLENSIIKIFSTNYSKKILKK